MTLARARALELVVSACHSQPCADTAGEAVQIHSVYFCLGKSSLALFFYSTSISTFSFKTRAKSCLTFSPNHRLFSSARFCVEPSRMSSLLGCTFLFGKNCRQRVPTVLRERNDLKSRFPSTSAGAEQRRNKRLAFRKSFLVAVNCRHGQLRTPPSADVVRTWWSEQDRQREREEVFLFLQACLRIQHK